MSKTINMVGKYFGRWVVVKREYPNIKGEPAYLCKCICGTSRIVNGGSLRRGISKSCGCRNIEIREKKKLMPGIANMHQLIILYKRNAKKRGHIYNLTEEQFNKITKQNCYYCGAEPSSILEAKYSNGEYAYNGLDRVDNNKGYEIDNVVPCCKICNWAKHQSTQQEYKEWIKKSYNNIFEKNENNN